MNQEKKRQKIKAFLKALICFLLFWFSGYLQVIPVWLFHITKITETTQIFLSLFSNFIIAIVLILLYLKDLKKEWKIFKANHSDCIDVGLKYWMIGLFIMMGTNIIINLFSKSHLSGNEKVVQEMITVLPWAMLINAGILAPIAEEITFRKAFRNFLSNKWVFALTSGLIFGGLHIVGNISSFVDFFYIIPYGALGTCFALAYDETDNVFTSMFFHFFHNTVLTILSIL